MNERGQAPKCTPPTEQRLQAVTVGKVNSLNGNVLIVPYDPEWPLMYARLARQIRDALGAKALMIEHVGSTSVAGLSAKPVIDMVLAVADCADESSYLPSLERAGYVLRIREPDWFEHRLLKSPAIEGNLHVFSKGCGEIDRMLAFRDWLRENDDDRKLYARTKHELAGRTWKFTQDYADAKSNIVEEILGRASGLPQRGNS